MRLPFLLLFGLCFVAFTIAGDEESSEEKPKHSAEEENDFEIDDEEDEEDDSEDNPFSFDEDDEDEDKEIDEIVDSKPIDYTGDPIGEWDEEEPLEPLEFDSEDEEELADDKADFIEYHEKFKENVKKADMKEAVQNFKLNNKELKEKLKEKKNFTIGPSPFMYLSQGEIKKIFIDKSLIENRIKPNFLKSGLKKVKKGQAKRSSRHTRSTRRRKIKLPKNFDWRKKNVLPPIRNQGQCGSCWAFSTTTPIEVSYARKYGKKIDLSEEQLQCVYNQGTMCDGGLPEKAFEYLLNSSGQTTEKAIPYTEMKNSTCKRNVKPVVKLASVGDLYPFTMTKVKHALIKNGPISFGMYTNYDFEHYKGGGIFDTPCTKKDEKEGGHAMSIVGYGQENGTPYWIIRNSWAKTWGEQGYGRIKAGVDLCGMEKSWFMLQVQVE